MWKGEDLPVAVRFSKAVELFAKGAIREVKRKRDDAAYSLISDIIDSTPVGDPELWNIGKDWKDRIIASGYKGGTLKANWQAIAGVANTIGEVKTPDKSGNAAKSRARRNIKLTRLEDTIVLGNGIPYAWLIEFTDHSVQQAPFVMVLNNANNWDLHVRTA